MKLARALGLLCAAVLVAVAAWSLWHRPDGAPDSGREARDDRAAEAAPLGARGRGGVGVRARDRDGSAQVRAELVDVDGAPVTDGVVMLECLQADAVRSLGSVSIGAEGTFEAQGCRGVVCATLKHPYLVPAEAWVLAPGATTQLVARPLRRLWGEVVTEDGEPVEAASVTFAAVDDDGERDPFALVPLASRSTTTDADGRFSVAWLERPPCDPCAELRGCEPLPLGAERLLATAGSKAHASTRVAFDAERDTFADPDTPLRLTVGTAGDLLTGRLRGPNGGSYARAYVLARSTVRPREQRRADVGPSGDFEIDGLGEGPYALRAIADGVELATAQAQAGEDVRLEGGPSAQGPALIVQAQDDAGAPLAGARVDGGPFRGDKTDARGEARAESALPGDVAVRVRWGPKVVRAEVKIPEPTPGETAHPHRVQVVVP